MNNADHQKIIRWGIVGCGTVCEHKSGPAFRKVEGSELKAVMRRDLDKARDYAKRHNVGKYYDDADTLIHDEEVDAIYIATPPDTHKALALKVADAGKPCCIEKPMALNYEQCVDILQAFEKKQIPLFVSYYRRSLPRFVQVREWIENGKIGKVRHLNWRFNRPPHEQDYKSEYYWRTDPKIAPGGYFDDIACHGLNLFEYLVGRISDIKGLSTNQLGLYEAKDAMTCCWQFHQGATGTAHWNFGSFERADHVEILGSEGTIHFSVFNEETVSFKNASEEASLFIEHPEHVQYFHVENMVKHLRGQSTHPSLGSSAAKTNWLMDEILKPSKA